MPTASNVGGGDSPQMGRPPKPIRRTGRNGKVLNAIGVVQPGGSHGEHPNARRERLKRIASGVRGGGQ